MLALAVRYLTGRAGAAHPANPDEPEWPPHPGRLFMAIVAAWGSMGKSAAGKEALEMLERLPPPALHVPPARLGAAVSFYVPTNDKRANPVDRRKAERRFPAALPDNDTVYFIWSQSCLDDHLRASLGDLCTGVTCLGHSSSLVSMSLAEEAPPPNLLPVEQGAALRLRVPTTGRLEKLESSFASGRRPDMGAWHGYKEAVGARVLDVSLGSFSPDLLILRRVAGPRLGLVSTLRLTEAMRGAAMRSADQPPCEILTGHGTDGGPSRRTHLAFIPLADVGHEHANGHLLGIAAALPRALEPQESSACVRAMARIEQLAMGELGEWKLESDSGFGGSRALAVHTWTRPSRRWATVTPVVLDRYPKRAGDAEEAICLACERSGLPRPTSAVAVPVSPILGVPIARSYPPLHGHPGRLNRWHTHAIVIFDEDVSGPVLLGSGRYRGYGVCRPLR
ncbi:MAG: type I-U CRISPR-associated protein Csb2 [Pseudomonadota bacterium]